MIPRYTMFSNRRAKKKVDELRAASLASEAAMGELKTDLTNEISVLNAEVKKLKEERDLLFYDIRKIMLFKSTGSPPDSKMQVPPSNKNVPPPSPEATPHAESTNTPRKTAWRTVDRKAHSRPIPTPKADSRLLHGVPSTTSWATWVPDPNTKPPSSPPPLHANPDVSGSPGLFGPRSRRNSIYGS